MYASEKFRALMSGTRFRAFAAKFPKFRALDPIVTETVTPAEHQINSAEARIAVCARNARSVLEGWCYEKHRGCDPKIRVDLCLRSW